MDILINKLSNEIEASKELKNIFGHVDADLSFKKLKADWRSACIEFRKLVGKECWDFLNDKYQNGDEIEIVEMAQYAIGCNALFNYLPKNDVSVSNNGRMMRRDEHNVAAFEHQTENHNDAMERSYYKSVDDFLLLMEEKNPNITTDKRWKDLLQYEKMQGFIIKNVDEFDTFFEIGSRHLFLKLLPAMDEFKTFELQPRINKDLDEVLSSSDKGLMRLIKASCVNYAMAWGLKRMRVTLFPKGVVQSFRSEGKTVRAQKTSQLKEAELAAQEFQKSSERYLKKIESIVNEEETDIGGDSRILGNSSDNFVSL